MEEKERVLALMRLMREDVVKDVSKVHVDDGESLAEWVGHSAAITHTLIGIVMTLVENTAEDDFALARLVSIFTDAAISKGEKK